MALDSYQERGLLVAAAKLGGSVHLKHALFYAMPHSFVLGDHTVIVCQAVSEVRDITWEYRAFGRFWSLWGVA